MGEEMSRIEKQPNYPVELLARAREMRESGAFNRRIIERTPDDLDFDRLQLECGHAAYIFGSLKFDSIDCSECVNRWMKGEHAGHGTDKQKE
jgi:hypothetical protein